MKRWGHGHTLAAGAVFGFGVATHLWLVVVAAFAAGVAAGRFWYLTHWVTEAIRDRVLHARKVKGLRAPIKAGRLPVDDIPY